jgi:hypothetical protein
MTLRTADATQPEAASPFLSSSARKGKRWSALAGRLVRVGPGF